MKATYIVMRPSGIDDQLNVILGETDRLDATRVKVASHDQPAVTWCPFCDTSNQDTFDKCGGAGCGTSIEYTYEEGDPQYADLVHLGSADEFTFEGRINDIRVSDAEPADTVVPADLSVKDIEALIPSWDFEKLLTMQSQEQNGRNRKGALELLNNAVVEAGSKDDDD